MCCSFGQTPHDFRWPFKLFDSRITQSASKKVMMIPKFQVVNWQWISTDRLSNTHEASSFFRRVMFAFIFDVRVLFAVCLLQKKRQERNEAKDGACHDDHHSKIVGLLLAFKYRIRLFVYRFISSLLSLSCPTSLWTSLWTAPLSLISSLHSRRQYVEEKQHKRIDVQNFRTYNSQVGTRVWIPWSHRRDATVVSHLEYIESRDTIKRNLASKSILCGHKHFTSQDCIVVFLPSSWE